jgi:hypothetical protein
MVAIGSLIVAKGILITCERIDNVAKRGEILLAQGAGDIL